MKHMKHGQMINREQRTTYGKMETLVDATTGKTIYRGPLCSSSQTVTTYHCDNCGPVEVDFFGLIVHRDACPNCGKEWEI